VTGWIRREEVEADDQAVGLPKSAGGAEIVTAALAYLGTPYVWGGQSPGGVDCSGFVYLVFTPYVPNLQRMSSYDYFHLGTSIARSALQPGDLVFFTTYAAGPSHVGIYIGEGKFVHASTAPRQVSVASLEEPYYAVRYLGARRLLGP